MIDLYMWTTPNGYKPLIMLEETGLPYTIKPIRLDGEQKSPEYLRINPNGRIPAIVDRSGAEPITVFESGAILIYLAEKTGQFLPAHEPARSTVMAWLMFQMGGVGPMFGQLGHFMNASEEVPYAIERYRTETERLYSVMETRLGDVEYLGGDYSIADMATYPWARAISYFGLTLDAYPNVRRWIAAIDARPAVAKAISTSLA